MCLPEIMEDREEARELSVSPGFFSKMAVGIYQCRGSQALQKNPIDGRM